ncbi:hypothetical protein GCK72_020604 [Caenorhabditis remanei]|uniref:CUB-like domain-containing protein n=1 Tax=Caenorhabditis remanei TaxID=31234 RepID=A0A6A5GHA5_CAERE|nr:hypothetical protein GCK72_020604 [Caenorhabditis remanei]KAF1754046.1 hypothetical protein GCK72_020604 [Caenorhabditis remanei]
MLRFIFFFICIASGIAVDLTCPANFITQNTPAGEFPAGGSATFPANYNCTIKFQIPVGSVVRLNISNNLFFTTADSFTIQDSASTFYSIHVTNSLFYLPATTGSIQLKTFSNTTQFYFKWQYIDVTGFPKIQKPTGINSIMSLNLTANTRYQFTSTQGQVAFHTGSVSGYRDQNLEKIYVYDGEDLNAKFLGNLYVFTDKEYVSTGKSLTLVNFYGSPVPSYGIANDYAAISGYDGYSFFVLRNVIEYFTGVTSKAGKESAITVYAIDWDESYIDYIAFKNPNKTGQEVRVNPMTPSETSEQLLTYNVQDFSLNQLPQQILTRIFTVKVYQSDVYLGIWSRPWPKWNNVIAGRTGWIYSPSIWNPRTLVVPQYLNTFNSFAMVKFTFDVFGVTIGTPGDILKVGVNSLDSFALTFNQTTKDTREKDASGTSMTTSFTGTWHSSSFVMQFLVKDYVETTTKSAGKIFDLLVVVLIALKIL